MSREYQGVDVDHPRIVEFVKQATKNGLPKEQIAKLAGMPVEVVEKHQREQARKTG